MTTVQYSLRTVWAHETFGYGLRIFVALSAVSLFCWHQQRLADLPSFFLGIVASILGETDDYWWQRLKAVLFLTLCFAITTIAVSVLFTYPILFVLGMSVSVLGWVILGALGERYSAIATSIIAIAIFSMLNIDQTGGRFTPAVQQSIVYMLAGSLGYGLLTVVWTILFANRPVREKLAQLMSELGQLLQLSAQGFEPMAMQSKASRGFTLAKQNARVMAALDQTYTAIVSRFGRSNRLGIRSGLFFRLYALGQEVHERVHSSHIPNEALAPELFHSDVLFRSQRLLVQLGQAFFDLSTAIRLNQPFVYSAAHQQALAQLRSAIDFIKQHTATVPIRLQRQLNALEVLYANLRDIDQRLSECRDAKLSLVPTVQIETSGQADSIRALCLQLIGQLSPHSIVFRFGIRLAIALAIGYVTIQITHVAHGYWILLTIAFVCRPNFGATRLRLVERVVGTLLGLVTSWLAIKLFPMIELQLILALLGTLIFATTRQDHYMIATAAVTVMAVFCFNLIGDGLLVIWPRMIDTLIGCLIAGIATLVIFPDWQGRRLNQVCAQVLQSCTDYLQRALQSELSDEAALRLAQRQMHNANAALSAVLTNMIHEPGRYRRNIDAGFNFLAMSNTLIGYLMAIGGYRNLPDTPGSTISRARDFISQTFSQLAESIEHCQALPRQNADINKAIAESLDHEIANLAHDDQLTATTSSSARVIYNELALMLRLYPKLEECAQTLILTSLKSAPEPTTAQS